MAVRVALGWVGSAIVALGWVICGSLGAVRGSCGLAVQHRTSNPSWWVSDPVGLDRERGARLAQFN